MYSYLDPAKADFRLLRLCASSDSKNISCEIHVFSLRDQKTPEWTALSYRWGDEDPAHTVCVNGHSIKVRTNLHRFLEQMSREKRFSWFFIDALCINQDDDREKAHQVSLMREIYCRAEIVLVWIVPESSWSASLPLSARDETRARRDARWEIAGESILHNSFWSRTWIVQEVLLARELVVQIGETVMPWDRVSWRVLERADSSERPSWQTMLKWRFRSARGGNLRANKNLTKLSGLDNVAQQEYNARQMLAWRNTHNEKLRRGQFIPFYQAVNFFATQSCSRPHDKIYGILGLTRAHLAVDYTTPVFDLFTATLANYFLSWDTEKSISYVLFPWDRWFPWQMLELRRVAWKVSWGGGMVAPFHAFEMDIAHPVVFLVVRAVIESIAPANVYAILTCVFLDRYWNRDEDRPKMEEMRRIRKDDAKEPVLSRSQSFVWDVTDNWAERTGRNDLLVAVFLHLQECKDVDAEMIAPGEMGVERRYSEWEASAKAICKATQELWGDSS